MTWLPALPALAASCGEFRRNSQNLGGICNSVVMPPLFVSNIATTKLDNRPNETYFLYLHTKQFRAGFPGVIFFTAGFETMTKAFLIFYTLYAISCFSRFVGKRKNPADCFPETPKSDTLKMPLVNHAKSRSEFFETIDQKTGEIHGLSVGKSGEILIQNLCIFWGASALQRNACLVEKKHFSRTSKRILQAPKYRFCKAKPDFYTAERRVAHG
nr:hypothetical protein [Nitrosomonas nitrosa]